MKAAARRVPFLVALAVTFTAALVPMVGAGAELDPLRKKIKAHVTRALTNRGLEVKRILPCRKLDAATYRCEWRVVGQYTDGPEYSCKGFATYFVHRPGKKLRLDPCLNAELWDLLVEAGLTPKAILNGKLDHGVYTFEWRAAGVIKGEVPYRCQDVATYVRRTREWMLGRCFNEIDWAVPLSNEPGPRPIFGIHDSWNELDKLLRLRLATDIGARVVRIGIHWGTAEPQNNSYNWGPYDVIVRQMLAAGVRPLLIPIGAPCWAAEENTPPCKITAAPSADHVGDFADFVGDLARHYPQAFGIEIWNEPNLSRFFSPSPDPERYARMVRLAAAAVDATGTRIPVVVGASAPRANTSSDGEEIAADEFLYRVFEAGGIGAADAVGAHVYFGHVDDYVLKMRQQIARLRWVMYIHSAWWLPIWITEYGIPSGEVGLDGQRKVLVDLYRTYRRIANVPVVVLYRMFDASDDSRGLIAVNGGRKPAYCGIGRAVGTFPANC